MDIIEYFQQTTLILVSNKKLMQEMIDNEGGDYQLASWDWWYYAEKIRQEKYQLDEEEVRAYLSLEAVTDGLFEVVNKLYGITLELRKDLPVYHEEVLPYEVKEADGSHLGILYMDFHPRPGKRSGAWSTGITEAHMKNGTWIPRVGVIVMNLPGPPAIVRPCSVLMRCLPTSMSLDMPCKAYSRKATTWA